MKIRLVAAATSAALLLLAACGGSESSTQDSTRTKNAALDQPTTTANSNTSNSTPTNKTCAQGGACVVGDTGPGGGIVFYAAQTLQPWGQYMEVSKQTIDPNFDTMWCDVMPSTAFANADALGNGRATTEFYAKACKRGQLRIATDLVQGNYDDWHLPTLADAKQMYLVREQLQLEGEWHYTATPNLADGKKEAWAVYMVEEQSMSMNPEAGYAGRAIRTFAPIAVPSCANGDACKVGDVGPGGGIVFYADATPQPWGQYIEASYRTLDTRFSTMWCDVVPTAELVPNARALGNGRVVTEAYAKTCSRGLLRMAADLVQGGLDDWHLPTIDEAAELYKNRKLAKIEGQWHYTATPDVANKQAYAFYMVNSEVRSLNPLAGFAGRAVRTFGPKSSTALTAPATIAPAAIPTTTIAQTTAAPTSPAPTTAAPKPTAPPTTIAATTTAATTAQGTSCATGGTCKVGDIGPKGGLVFHTYYNSSNVETYLEAVPVDRGRTQQCDANTASIPGTRGLLVGDGLANTQTIYNACGTGASRSIIKENGYYNRDWFIPSVAEMKAFVSRSTLLKSPLAPKLVAGDCYWTSSGDAKVTGKELTLIAMQTATGGSFYPEKPVSTECYVQPIRAFTASSVKQSATQNVVSATTLAPTTLPATKPTALTTLPPKPTVLPTLAPTTVAKPTPTTASAATTTAAAAQATSCATGGTCKVGDTGPAGGVVFYAAPTPQRWGQYFEATRFDMKANTWCNRAGFSWGSNYVDLSQGNRNTTFMSRFCTSGLGNDAANFAMGGYDDWFLPSRDEMIQLYLNRSVVGLSQGFYATSTQYDADNVWTLYGADGTPYPLAARDARIGRAIRMFGPKGVGTSYATKTDSRQPCAKGGLCRIGDVGPGGGIVFYVGEYRQEWGQYLEVAPSDAASQPTFWCATAASVAVATNPGLGAGKANTAANRAACQPGIGTLASRSLLGKTDWHVPSTLEAFYLMNTTSRNKSAKYASFLIKQAKGTCYWTSTDFMNGNARNAMYMEDGVGFNKANAAARLCLVRLVRAF